MKKLFLLLFISVFFISLYPPKLKAQNPGRGGISYEENQKSISVLNQTSINPIAPFVPIAPTSYSPGLYTLAVFDKRGNVQIGVRIIFDDNEKELLKDYSFFIPGEKIILSNILLENLHLKKECPQDLIIRNSPPVFPTPMPLIDKNFLPGMPEEINPMPSCNQYYVSKFTTLKPIVGKTDKGLAVTIKASGETTNTQSSLLLLYRSVSFAKPFLGNFYYGFDTLLIPQTAVTNQVGVSVKDGFYLKGAVSNYSYFHNFRAIEKAANLNREENQDLSNLLNEIIYQGAVRNGDSDVPPETPNRASGVYGPFYVLTYIQEISFGVLLIILLITGLIFIIRKTTRDDHQRKTVVITAIISFLTLLVIILLAGLFLMVKARGGLYF